MAIVLILAPDIPPLRGTSDVNWHLRPWPTRDFRRLGCPAFSDVIVACALALMGVHTSIRHKNGTIEGGGGYKRMLSHKQHSCFSIGGGEDSDPLTAGI